MEFQYAFHKPHRDTFMTTLESGEPDYFLIKIIIKIGEFGTSDVKINHIGFENHIFGLSDVPLHKNRYVSP